MPQDISAARLDLLLLGPPQAMHDGRSIKGFRSSKAQALLYFLAVTGRIQRRSILTALLWPEADEKQAGASLRNALSNLRALIGDHLTITREAAHLHRERLSLDVAQFEALLARTGDTETDIQQMEAAASLWRGDFLEGFHLADAPQFEQWATIERERLRRTVLNALLTLAEWHAGQADFAAGLEDLDRLLGIDPANEAGHRQKMIALARLGQRSAALQQYEACRRILAEELGAEPSPETTAAQQLILDGALPGQPQPVSEWLSPSQRRTRVDRREMPERISFYGRDEDLARARHWLATEEVGLVAITGMGGIGKTALAVELVSRLTPGSFDCILWRSLVNAPGPDAVLDGWLQVVAGPLLDRLPESIDDKLSMLFDALQHQRCLLVLDNLESIIESGDQAGQFRAGYEAYGALIARMGRSRHRSCLLFTARDLPTGLRSLEEDTPRVRVLPLEGLTSSSGAKLLRGRGVSAPEPALARLVEHYSGNPLALKLAADTVRDLFGDDVSGFLGGETPVLDDIRRVLDEQYGRLSELGREIAMWLAVERVPVTAQTLWQNLTLRPRRARFLEVIRSLQNGSLVEIASSDRADDGIRLALQNVVMEYLTDLLVTTLSDEIEHGRLAWLHRYALVKAQSEEHVQESQRRLLLEPVVQQLVSARGRSGAIRRLRDLLAHLQQADAPAASYGAANILHLFLHLETRLDNWDFSGAAIRQADLRTALLGDVDFRGADLSGSVFYDTFGAVRAIAISPDGRYLAAGDGDGGVFVWQMTDRRPHLVLRGHTQTVSSVAFSPDSTVLATGGYDGRVCVWDVATGERASVLAHTGTIGSVAFAPDGNFLASGGNNRQIVIWDWRRAQVDAQLQEAACVNGLAFSPDGVWLGCASDDLQVSLWDWRRRTLFRALPGHQSKVHAVAFSPNGAILASGGEDGRICLWNTDDLNRCRTLDGHAGWIWSLAFSPDGGSLVSAGTDRTVRLWDAATGQIRRTLVGHASWVDAVAYSPDGTAIASGGYDQSVRIWDAHAGLGLHTLHGHQRRLDLVNFSADGALLASSSLDGPMHLWATRSGRHLHSLAGHRGAIRAVAFSEAHELIAGGCDDHRVYLWDTASGRLKHALQGHTDLVRHVAFSPDGRNLVTGSHDRTLHVWEATTGRLQHIIHDALVKIQSAASFSPDGRVLAYGGADESVRLWDVATAAVMESLPVGGERPSIVAFSPRGGLLACGTESGAIWVWQVKDEHAGGRIELRFRIQPKERLLWRVLFSPEEKLMAVCGDGGTRQIINLASGEVAYPLPNAPGAFTVAFACGGQTLATAGAGRTILVHDAATGEVRQTLAGHLAEVTSLDVSPTGDVLASSSVDGSVRLWDLETGDCLANLEPPGPYAGMKIAGASGITSAQRVMLIALGATEN